MCTGLLPPGENPIAVKILIIIIIIYSPFFFSSKCSLFHNANLFGPCIIHILYTGCAKIKKNNSGTKGLIQYFSSIVYVAQNEMITELLIDQL